MNKYPFETYWYLPVRVICRCRLVLHNPGSLGYRRWSNLSSFVPTQAKRMGRMTKTTTHWICPSAQSHLKVGRVRPPCNNPVWQKLPRTERVQCFEERGWSVAQQRCRVVCLLSGQIRSLLSWCWFSCVWWLLAAVLLLLKSVSVWPWGGARAIAVHLFQEE